MKTSRIQKIGYEIDGDRILDDYDDFPKVKSRRLDLENCHFVDLVSVTLRLNTPAVLYYIRIGKFCHQRVNRIRLKNNNGILLFDLKVLANDSVPKEYKLLRIHDGEDIVSFELQFEYKKRVDVWSGMSTIISFDAVDLDFFGINDSKIIQPAQERLRLSRERWAWDLCFSHLIHFGHADIVSVLERRLGFCHIHPTIDTLCRSLYFKNDYNLIENLMKAAAKSGDFDECAKNTPAKILWDCNFIAAALVPPERINPQLCIDSKLQIVYVFGGASRMSNRNESVLDDFWCFDVMSKQWQSISASTLNEDGPCGRTKATMFFDEEKKSIYICGGSGQNFKVLDDLYQYNIVKKTWKKITSRICTNCDLIHTYAFCYGKDVNFSIYCFPWNQSPHFKHFKLNSDKLKLDKSIFTFNIHTHERRCVLLDETGLTYSFAVFNPKSNSFYLIGKETSSSSNMASYYKCLFEFSVKDEKCAFVSDLPFSGRVNCMVDEETGDLYACAFSEPSTSLDEIWNNQFWKFCALKRKWEICGRLGMTETSSLPPSIQKMKNFDVDITNINCDDIVLPLPRRAAGFTFDSSKKTFYMFGGILSQEIEPTPSLNELYLGKLIKTDAKNILRKCVWHIRINHFIEVLAKNEPSWQLKALAILRRLNADFTECKYNAQTNRMSQLIFKANSLKSEEKSERERRMHKLFLLLCSMFPKSVQPPKDNLLNLVNQIACSSTDSSWDLPQTSSSSHISLKNWSLHNHSLGSKESNGLRFNSNKSRNLKKRNSYFD